MANNENNYNSVNSSSMKAEQSPLYPMISLYIRNWIKGFGYFRWCKHRDREDVVMDDPITFTVYQ